MMNKGVISSNQNIRRGIEFEKICMEIFEANGFDVVRPEALRKDEGRNFGADFLIKGSSELSGYVVEVKIYGGRKAPEALLRKAADRLLRQTLKWNERHGAACSPLLLVGAVVDESQREALREVVIGNLPKAVLQESYNLQILDIANLLYLVERNEKLSIQLRSIMGYSLSEIFPKESPLFQRAKSTSPALKQSEKEKDFKYFEKRYAAIKPGKDDAGKFELLCCDALNLLFSDCLDNFEGQKPSSDGMHRFDLVVRIKADSTDDPWLMFRDHLNSKYVLFEFKNKKGKLAQNDIYITEKYLHKGALRCVAFIISRHGIAKNADRAIRGILRENEKLIVSLTWDDIVKMLEGREAGDPPSYYLQGVIDHFLVNLDK